MIVLPFAVFDHATPSTPTQKAWLNLHIRYRQLNKLRFLFRVVPGGCKLHKSAIWIKVASLRPDHEPELVKPAAILFFHPRPLIVTAREDASSGQESQRVGVPLLNLINL
jgi:hypothetical protein